MSGAGAPAAPFEWRQATPESHGLSSVRVDAFRENLAARTTKTLLLIHDDEIVCEWYAPGFSPTTPHYTASMAKAIAGGLALGIAISDGRLTLDTRVAGKLIPQWQSDGLKSRITLRELGSHTSGIADAEEGGRPHDELTGWKGDFWKQLPVPRDPFSLSRDVAPLIFEPGTRRQYSNPGIAMMSYATTAALRDAPEKDIRTLLRDRVMRPIGVPDEAWSVGYGKTFVVDDLPLVGTWGGGGFTARATARIGRLMMRKGDWQGRQILSAEATQDITTDAGTPGPGSIGFWNNLEGFVPALPRDAFWGAGAGGQVVLMVPSLKLLAVRNGGSLDPGDNDVALAKHFFTPLAEILTSAGIKEPPSTSRAVLPGASSRIKDIVWAPRETIIRCAKGGDNWPMTWGDDDALYTAYGDGNGFEPFVPEKLSLGLGKVVGSPPDFQGVNLRSPSIETRGDGASARKASGILMVDGVLYLMGRNAGNAQIAWSGDHGVSWTWAGWKFTGSFGAPAFINFGRNHAGALDDYIYLVSHDANSAYEVADAFVLARAPRGRLLEQGVWEYFAGMERNEPRWVGEVARREPILTARGQCYRAGVTYNAALKRYLLVHPVPSERSRDHNGRLDTRFAGGLAVYEAKDPWGHWIRVSFSSDWDVGPGDTASFPTKWMSADGRSLLSRFLGR